MIRQSESSQSIREIEPNLLLVRLRKSRRLPARVMNNSAASRLAFALALSFPFSTADAAPSAPSAPARKPDASDEFFNSGYIPHIRIEIGKKEFEALRRDERQYVRCTIREGTNVWEEIGIHKKGAAGSNRDFNDRPALTLNFDKFVDRQKFHGLDKFHLNNSVQDNSLLCEAICAKLFLDGGVPASRVTHARVELNGRDLGMYVLKEGFDKTFLKRHFKNANGNLYDAGFLHDIDAGLEKDSGTGDVKNQADLKALVAAARDPDPVARFRRLEKLLDLDRFIDFLALEIMTWHWDGYYMKRNNYRVYHDPDTDKLHFFPHGMDQMFWSPDGAIFPRERDGLVSRALLDTPEGRLRYRQRMAALLTNVFTAEKFTNHIAQLQSRLQPALQRISPEAARNQASKSTEIRNAVLNRIKHLDRQLNHPPPKPIRFDADGIAALTKWEVPDTVNELGATFDRPTDSDGRKTLHIVVAKPGERCIGSWRARVMLDAGHYVLEGRVRTVGVTSIQNETGTPKGVGAGLRLSQPSPPEPRKNQLTGDAGWTKLEYEFTVSAGPDEKVLICELRALEGEAWFDLESLKLRKR